MKEIYKSALSFVAGMIASGLIICVFGCDIFKRGGTVNKPAPTNAPAK